MECEKYLVYREGLFWRVACQDGHLYSASGLYDSEEAAIKALDLIGAEYEVIKDDDYV